MCSGAVAGIFLEAWHASQARTHYSMSLSTVTHHTWLRAMAFILTMPGWPRCCSATTSGCLLGYHHSHPQRIQPPSRVISSLHLQNGRRVCGTCLDQPPLKYCTTFFRMVSDTISAATARACTGKASSWPIMIMVVSSRLPSGLELGNGNLDITHQHWHGHLLGGTLCHNCTPRE